MTTETIPDVLGASIKRVEDPRFITGSGNYVDDIKLASMAHMAVLRSPYAHANIRSIDTSAAKAMPGVVAVFVGADIAYNPMPMAWPAGGSAGIQNNINTPSTLATDSVKWTGEGVAAVVADTEAQAFDALEAIVVDYEPLPAVVDADKAIEPGAPQLHENAPNNIVFEWTVGDKAGTDAAIDAAEVVVRQRIVNQRLIPNSMETRGDIGWYNPGTDEYTIWMSSQTPHIQRLLLAAFVMGVPEHKIRCISPDIGGAFGTRIYCYTDYALVLFASKALAGRPVKWIESRTENYQSTIHGRDHITHLEIAGTRDGEITGLRVKTLANLGGRLSTIGPGVATTLYGRVLTGCYKIPNVYADGHRGLHEHDLRRRLPRRGPARGDLRHRAGDGPVRGGDRDGPRRDPAPELHPAGPVPVRQPVRSRDRVGRRQDLHRFRQLRAGHGQGARDGRLRRPGGEEGRGQDPRQAARHGPVDLHRGLRRRAIEVDRRGRRGLGRRDVGIGQHQDAPDRARRSSRWAPSRRARATRRPTPRSSPTSSGIPMADIVVQHSDTQGTPFGYGTYGSRTSSVGSTAAIKAAGKIREKARRMAAHMLEASVDDIEIDGANYFVKGSPDRVKTIQEIAFAIDLAFDPPEGMEPYLDETAYYDTPNCTWPFGTHIAIVEIDEETGHVDLVRYLAVDDVGKKINPMIVDGQLHGGIAQGVGQALWEGAIYDDQGQLQTGSMMDYTVPRASFFPEHRARRDGHAVTGQPARGQGRRRGRGDREHRGGGQCGHRRAQPARHPPSRHAVHGPDRVACDPGFEGRPGVIPAAFAYQRPASIEEALAIIGSDPGAKVLAGGQSLLPLLKLRLGSAETLVDIGRLPGLRGRPPARRRPAGDRRPDDLRRVARVAGGRVRPPARRAAPHRRRPGPQPRDDRRLDRPCRPGVGPAGLPARARGGARHPVGRRRADDPDRRVLRGRLHDRRSSRARS